ncbi:MAG: hypothetical protein KDD43_03990 [Bdellovibrionales bacterium]|nr:hypothetical protein [Bdellovibrionales bacterium]
MKLLVLLAMALGFTQAWATNKLPTSFSFTGEGVGGNVKVVANVLYSLEQGGVPTPDADKLELLLLKFLDLQTGGGAPGFFFFFLFQHRCCFPRIRRILFCTSLP